MTLLLDTNAYSAWKRGDERVARRIRAAENLLFSSVVAGELLYGFRNGSRYEQNLRELEELLNDRAVRLVPVTFRTADRYARLAASLRRKGRPIPTNDIWIAAHTMETGAELLSFDEHFAAVDALVWTHLGTG